ncbi:hypothetical protein Goarm_002173, partial [Gossypium armourianum]|nr:hypothetical protein [Gossypium armourianum]
DRGHVIGIETYHLPRQLKLWQPFRPFDLPKRWGFTKSRLKETHL